jgi:hypothetical protein
LRLPPTHNFVVGRLFDKTIIIKYLKILILLNHKNSSLNFFLMGAVLIGCLSCKICLCPYILPLSFCQNCFEMLFQKCNNIEHKNIKTLFLSNLQWKLTSLLSHFWGSLIYTMVPKVFLLIKAPLLINAPSPLFWPIEHFDF